MPDLTWIKNGRIVDPVNGRDEVGDIYVNEGRIVGSLSTGQRKGAHVIDAGGLLVCPGLVDIHVHFREPGQTHKETIQTGSHAAAAGGFTSVICMPNTTPAADDAGTIQYIQDAIQREAVVRVYPTGCITVGMNGERLAPIGSLKRAGVVAITDDGKCVQNNELMRRAVEYASMFSLPVMDHCEDSSLTRGAVMNEGVMSTRLGLQGWPAAAEDIIVSRNVILSTHTGAHIHLQHISSATSVDIIRRAKKRGVSITAEATPHHLALTEATIAEYDTNFKMNPPLRTEEDRQALIDGLRDGTLDCVATDHAPHTDYEKDKEFDFAPFGIVGLETALPISLQVLHRESGFSLLDSISLLTSKPADVMNLDAGSIGEGAKADIAIIDPDETWTVTPESLHSKSANSPWLGVALKGRVRKTLLEGKPVFADGRILTG
ncbi:MAG: dihydroorotase [Verrucomicrobia bacterium]|nr:MAG: dihydroorotase [Verrucomicrobiota bacterium]